MKNEQVLTRRTAISATVSAIALSAAPGLLATAGVGGPASRQTIETSLEAFARTAQLDMVAKLSTVRSAFGTVSRRQAFIDFKAAYAAHDFASSAVLTAQARPARGTGLYLTEDPSRALARVLIRELDSAPKLGSAWLRRFSELEQLVQA